MRMIDKPRSASPSFGNFLGTDPRDFSAARAALHNRALDDIE
jgi:hypothetical protein